jgi:ParB-like chromosome segregation protein Spo0J
MEEISLNLLIPHPNNPRTISARKFEYLKQSLLDFPEMLKIRPIIVNLSNEILCGNMRYQACKEIGRETIFVTRVDLSEERAKELIVKDNLSYGDWDMDALEFGWDMASVEKWLGKESIDYTALDDYEDVLGNIEDFYNGVKKAIQIEVGTNYETAKELERQCREADIYIGGEFIQYLQDLLR